MLEKITVDIYKSSAKEGLYIYLKSGASNENLPEELRIKVGELKQVMTLEIDSSTKLANADVLTVMKNLRDKGYYLQFPPIKSITNLAT